LGDVLLSCHEDFHERLIFLVTLRAKCEVLNDAVDAAAQGAKTTDFAKAFDDAGFQTRRRRRPCRNATVAAAPIPATSKSMSGRTSSTPGRAPLHRQ